MWSGWPTSRSPIANSGFRIAAPIAGPDVRLVAAYPGWAATAVRAVSCCDRPALELAR